MRSLLTLLCLIGTHLYVPTDSKLHLTRVSRPLTSLDASLTNFKFTSLSGQQHAQLLTMMPRKSANAFILLPKR